MTPKKSLLIPVAILALAVTVRAATPAPAATVAGPRLTDPQFFGLLDLTRPDLAAVSNAAARADWPAATAAFAGHLRTRAKPRWDVDPFAVGRTPKYHNGTAADALAHKLHSIGIPWQFGDRIDWTFNPTTQPGSPWPVNHEWTWQLSRHTAWVELARAYHATGDEKYAAEFAAQLKSWIHDCPVPVGKADNRAGSRWRTIEAGIRTGSVWPVIWPRILAAKSIDDATLVLMTKSWVEHARYLTEFHASGNWLTMEANGLFHVGALFPEFRDAAAWRATALERLTAELDIQVYPDGAQIELAPGYHGVSLRNFLGPVDLAASTGFSPPPAYLAKTERMFQYYLLAMSPTRCTPPLNDSGAGSVVSSLREGAERFPQREDFRWVASDGATGRPPAFLSCALPYAGQVFLRSGWGAKDLWLCMDAGPFGFGHQHEDKLSVILTAFGKALLVEGGVYTYDASDWRRYVLSSRAHNVVLVDGLDQNRRKSPRESWVVRAPVPLTWSTNAAFDRATASYDEGWGPDAKRLARHTRDVVFVKPSFFVVADRLESLDGQPHRYEALFHLDAEDARTDGLTVATAGPGPSLAIRAFGAGGVTVVKGAKEPVVQGWLPGGGGYGSVRPIPTAIYATTSAAPASVIYVLYPTAGPAACPVRGATREGRTLRIQMDDGTSRTMEL